MIHLLRRILFLLIFLSPINLWAETNVYSKTWIDISLVRPLTQDGLWSYYLSPEIRLVDNTYKLSRLSLYLGLKYHLNPNASLWIGGFRSFQKSLTSGEATGQNRLWEQFLYNAHFGKELILSSRTRLEQRQQFEFAQINQRFRQMFRFIYSLPTKGEKWLHIGDEMFFLLNHPSWVSNRTFSQNRAFIGVEFPINQTQSYEIGYLNQLVYNEVNDISHVLYLTFNL